MAKGLITHAYLEDTADAIRVLRGESDTYTPDEFGEKIIDAIPTETASGNLIHITDAANFPAESVVTTLEPIQEGSGDPSPENVRPITGHTGVYLVNGENVSSNGITTLEPIQEGSGDPSPENVRPILPALSFERDNGDVLDVYGCEIDWVNSILRVTNANADLGTLTWGLTSRGYFAAAVADIKRASSDTELANIKCSIYKTDTSSNIYYSRTDKAICVAVNASDIWVADSSYSSASDFKTAMNGVQLVYELAIPIEIVLSPNELERVKTILKTETHSVTFPQAQSPVYGCEVDWTNGVLRVDRVKVTKQWRDSQYQTIIGTVARKEISLPNSAVYPPTTGKPQLCSLAPYKANYFEDSVHFYVNANSINQLILFLPVGTSDDTEIEVSYELATPLETPLTPEIITLLKGENNVWTDAGTNEIEYKVDLNSYIQKLIDEASAQASTLSMSPLSLGKSAVLTSTDGEDADKIEDADEPASDDEEAVLDK